MQYELWWDTVFIRGRPTDAVALTTAPEEIKTEGEMKEK